MKKFTLSILLLASVVIAKAQDATYKPFKFDLAIGYASPGGGEGAKGGFLIAGEPKYAVLPNVSVGLRFEAAIMARAQANADGSIAKADAKAAGSYLATGEYYFTETTVRPFAGLGLGIYSLAAASATSDGSAVGASGGSKFGEMIRAGVEIAHFRLGVEYNFIPKTKYQVVSSYQNGQPVTSEFSSKNGYLGVKVGFFIGGGKN